MTKPQVVVVDRDDADFVRQLSTEYGVQANEVPTRGIEPLTTVTFVLIGSVAVVATVVHLIDARKGGQVIDLRPGAPKTIYRSKDVVYGLIIVILDGGQVTVEVREPRGIFGTVVDALQNIAAEVGTAGIDAIASAVQEQFGNSIVVQAEAIPDSSTVNNEAAG